MTQVPLVKTVVAKIWQCQLPIRVRNKDVVTQAIFQIDSGMQNVNKTQLRSHI